MRVVVVEPPPPGAPSLGRSALAVGAFDWLDPAPTATVVVKATYRREGDRLVLAPEQKPLALADVASLEAGLWGELHYPWDLAPHKPQADVLVVGHASAGEGPPAEDLPVRIAVGALDRAVLARAASPAPRIPLNAVCLFTPDGEHPERVGPARLPAETRKRRALDHGDDYAVYNAAPEGQRRAYLRPREKVALRGLTPAGALALELPAEAPRVQVSWRGALPDVELQMVADTLWIDADREIFVLVWRGMTATPKPASVARIAVSLERAGAQRSWGEILRSAARGAFALSASPDEPGGAPRDDEERDRITAARFDLALGELGPEPTISLDQYAALSAELAEQREPRADVLARHDLDEMTWMLEERGWLEAMAAGVAEGDDALAAAYGEKYVAAQDALAAPAEAARTRADWAELTAAVEASGDLSRTLARREIGLSAWMRLERRMEREAAGSEDDEEPITERPAALGPGGDV